MAKGVGVTEAHIVGETEALTELDIEVDEVTQDVGVIEVDNVALFVVGIGEVERVAAFVVGSEVGVAVVQNENELEGVNVDVGEGMGVMDTDTVLV